MGQEDPLEKEMATTPVFLPGEFHGQRSLMGYNPWGRKELNTTKRLTLSLSHTFYNFIYKCFLTLKNQI